MNRALLGIPLLILVSGCNSRPAGTPPDRPVQGFDTSWAISDCAPWDGAATTIFFADSVNLPQRDADYPHLWVSLYRPTQALAGEVFTWDQDEKDVGGAMWCPGPSHLECEASTSARVTIDGVDLSRDSTITGMVDFIFPDRGPVKGTFIAVWLDHQPICG